jgi:hypothetical protein
MTKQPKRSKQGFRPWIQLRAKERRDGQKHRGKAIPNGQLDLAKPSAVRARPQILRHENSDVALTRAFMKQTTLSPAGILDAFQPVRQREYRGSLPNDFGVIQARFSKKELRFG